ncbi:ATP-dependent RecD-like DNA helicase [bacterium HR32]|nr:ATP-dependent RecD-like DNA helicase [bacterium HR32]
MAVSGLDLNREFRRALELLEGSRRHVLVTGRAGTGKSTLLRYFLQTTRKRAVVLAPTGVAAVNVGGQTIHSFFGFRPDVTPDRVPRLMAPEGRDSVYKRLEVLVLDEVSMVRADLLDCVDRFLRLNGPKRNRPFGGVQMAFFGDLYQLPPVVTGAERRALEALYETPYFYSAKAFAGLNVELVELEKVYRQQDGEFLELLGAIRNGSVTDDHLELLNRRVQPTFEPPPEELYVQLTATNRLAEATNRDQLARLPGRPYRFFGTLEGEFGGDHAPAPVELEIKVGAQIMMVSNDAQGRWVNGTVGRVAGVPVADGDEPLVLVELEDGTEVEITPYTWELFSFYVEGGELRSRVVGQYTQLPMTLAWAVTIHKSQGKTFDRVVIDIGRGAFAPGQVYVALSRCRTLEGIVLRRPIERKHVWVDYRIVKFLTRFQYERAERALPVEARRALLEQAVRECRSLEIVYLKPNGDRSRRVVRPIRVEEVEYRGRTFLGLRAFCGHRQEERTFRVDRILELGEAAD